MYRIIDTKEGYFRVQKNRKWIIPWKWHDCKLEVFVGAGIIVSAAIFKTKKEAELYIKHKGSIVNGLISGHYFYNN